MSSEIRIPKQKRSIDKMNKITDAGFILFCEKGYFKTNTAEIAKKAGVSIGIVYSYFKDKKDIFFHVLDIYTKQINSPLINAFKELKPPYELENILNQIFDSVIESHTMTLKAHEEMIAMSYTDNDVREYFMKFEEDICHQYVDVLTSLGFQLNNPYETVQIIIDLLENYVHDYMYHRHECVDYQAYREKTIDVIIYLLKQ